MSKKMPHYLLGGQVIAKVLESKETKTDSGVIIPSTANANFLEGLVKMIDKGVSEYVKVGDIVIWPEGAGLGQHIDNAAHVWLNINEIKGGFSMDKEDE